MMIRRSLTLASGLLLALALAAPASAKKAGLFNRILAATGGLGRKAAMSDVLAVSGDLPDATKGAGEALQDMWEDADMKVLNKMMEGDYLGIFEEFAFAKDAEQIWKDRPDAVAKILQANPIFEGIKGVPEIMAKAADQVTSDDGMFVLDSMRKLVKAYVEKSKEMGTTEGLQGMFDKYQKSPAFKPFYDKIAAADTDEPTKAKTFRQLQQAIADDIWGGMIDLDKFGLNGEVPRAIKETRDFMINETPDVWELVTQSDPLVKAILMDPFKAADIAQEAYDIADKVNVPGYEGPIGP